MSERPTTYFDWLRVTVKGCLLGWSLVPEHALDAWRSLRSLLSDAKYLMAVLILPLLIPLSPIIALLLRREYRRQEAKADESLRRWAE